MNEEKDLTRRCLECGAPLPPGRSDMKFCCARCKNSWNYRLSGAVKKLKLRTLHTINSNYSILESLIGEGTVSMDIPDLADRGFKFDYVTSYHRIRGHDEFRIYDIRYFKSESRVFGICRGERPKKSSEK